MHLVLEMSTVKRMGVYCLQTFVVAIFDRVNAFEWMMVDNQRTLFPELSDDRNFEETLAFCPECLRGWLSLSECALSSVGVSYHPVRLQACRVLLPMGVLLKQRAGRQREDGFSGRE